MDINPDVNPEAANAAAQAAISGGTSDTPPMPPQPVKTTVDLPGGFINLTTRAVSKEARVRELTGEDEEAITRVSDNLQRYFDTILERGTVSIGEAPATKDLLDEMLAGDRDALLIGIRRVSFGDEIKYNATCPTCKFEQEVVVDLGRDISYDKLDDVVAGREFQVSLPSGEKATVTLPTGTVAKALASSQDRSDGVLNTILLSHCVEEVGGMPTFGAGTVKALSIRDRRALLSEISDRNPGPRLGEVSRPCSSCGEDIPLLVTLVDLFLF